MKHKINRAKAKSVGIDLGTGVAIGIIAGIPLAFLVYRMSNLQVTMR